MDHYQKFKMKYSEDATMLQNHAKKKKRERESLSSWLVSITKTKEGHQTIMFDNQSIKGSTLVTAKPNNGVLVMN